MNDSLIFVLFSPWCLFLGLTIGIYFYLTKNFTHWRDMGVPFRKPHLLFGNTSKRITLQISYPEMLDELYQQFDGEKIAGIFEGRLPRLMIRDPELLRQVLVSDFDSFVDRALVSIHPDAYEENMLLSLKGSHWKALRSVSTPIFSSGKIRAMSNLVTKCAGQLCQYLDDYVIPEGGEVDAKEMYGRFTMDVIGTCGFGVQCNSLQDPDAEFVRVISKFSDLSAVERFKFFVSILVINSSTLARLIGVHFMNQETVRYVAGLVFKSKKERASQINSQRVDFLKLMFDAQAGKLKGTAEKSKDLFEKDAQLQGTVEVEKTVLTDEILVGQCLLFLLAGFDTSSTLLSFASYELALNPDIQEKAREEVVEVLGKSDGELNYDVINDMPYLENVLLETLRRHPPVSRVERTCTASSYKIPGTSAVLKKGDVIMIPIRGLALDPKHFPDPFKFDPDRFLPEEKAKRSPYVFLPFGSGPRNCIGMRFAMMSTKLAMATLLKSYKFETCNKTKVPYKMEKAGNLLKAKDGVWIKISKI